MFGLLLSQLIASLGRTGSFKQVALSFERLVYLCRKGASAFDVSKVVFESIVSFLCSV